MPLYEYQCDSCNQRFEVIQKFSDPPPETCTRCGKGPVHRLVSTPAIQFKGSGWYITDYGGGRSSSATSAGAGDGESKGDGKKEGTKPSSSESTAKTDASGSAPAAPATKD